MCFKKQTNRIKKEANLSIHDLKMNESFNKQIDDNSFFQVIDFYLAKSGENEFIKLGFNGFNESNREYNFNIGFTSIEYKFNPKKSGTCSVKISKSRKVKELYERVITIINNRILENNKINKLEKAKHSKFFIDDISKLEM